MTKISVKMTPFTLKVISLIKKIPRGKVATYGQIARLAGKPHSARAVGWILNSCARKYKLPWQRILNSQGKISFHPMTREFVIQKRLLENEGVIVSHSGSLNLYQYQWHFKISSKVRQKK